MPLKPKLVLKGGKEKHIRHGHPWIFASAIERVEDSPQPGWTADVVTYDGRWVAKAGYSPKSQLRARVWTLVDGEEIDEAFFERRIQSAVAVRHRLGRMEPAGGCRLINAGAAVAEARRSRRSPQGLLRLRFWRIALAV